MYRTNAMSEYLTQYEECAQWSLKAAFYLIISYLCPFERIEKSWRRD